MTPSPELLAHKLLSYKRGAYPCLTCWADPQDNGLGIGDNRRVMVRQPGQKPRSMSLRDAKIAGCVPDEVTYSSLPKEPY